LRQPLCGATNNLVVLLVDLPVFHADVLFFLDQLVEHVKVALESVVLHTAWLVLC